MKSTRPVLKLQVVAACAALTIVSACSTPAQWRVDSAVLLDRPTTISDGMGNDISAVGYIKLTLIPDPDRYAAMDERPRQTLTVRDCGSGERLSASYLYERPYDSESGLSYNYFRDYDGGGTEE